MRVDSKGVVAALGMTALLLVPAPTTGQTQATPLPDHEFTSCSIVGLLSGVSIASSEASPTLGGMFGWPLTARVGLEVAGAWSDTPRDGSGFAAGLSLRRNFTARQTLVPYMKAGVGVYVATVDAAKGTPPDFYLRRFGPGDERVDGTRHTFSDPALVLGGGVSWFLGRRLALRPEVETFIIRGGSRTSAVTSFVARLEYHFEDYRITRNRASR